MALFRIDLRLKPAPDDEHKLAGWPEKELLPDFIVVTSGLARFELESRVVGTTAEGHQPTATTTDHLNSKQVNYWLPDYTGGFALNLANAALQVKKAGQTPVVAKFIDEPLELRLEKHGDHELKVSFVYNAETVATAPVPTALVIAEVGRTLQDFVVQILTHNPRLAAQPDVARLQGLVGQLLV